MDLIRRHDDLEAVTNECYGHLRRSVPSHGGRSNIITHGRLDNGAFVVHPTASGNAQRAAIAAAAANHFSSDRVAARLAESHFDQTTGLDSAQTEALKGKGKDCIDRALNQRNLGAAGTASHSGVVHESAQGRAWGRDENGKYYTGSTPKALPHILARDLIVKTAIDSRKGMSLIKAQEEVNYHFMRVLSTQEDIDNVRNFKRSYVQVGVHHKTNEPFSFVTLLHDMEMRNNNDPIKMAYERAKEYEFPQAPAFNACGLLAIYVDTMGNSLPAQLINLNDQCEYEYSDVRKLPWPPAIQHDFFAKLGKPGQDEKWMKKYALVLKLKCDPKKMSKKLMMWCGGQKHGLKKFRAGEYNDKGVTSERAALLEGMGWDYMKVN